jgi:hypothetical protein
MRCTYCNRIISETNSFDLCDVCLSEFTDQESYTLPEALRASEFDKYNYLPKTIEDIVNSVPDPLWDFEEPLPDDDEF